jgi:hypothetical protein
MLSLRAPARPRFTVISGTRDVETAIEITIAWDDTTLHVAHLGDDPHDRRGARTSRFVLSDELPPGVRGFAVPSGSIAVPGGELLVDHPDGVAVVVPLDARATFVDRGRVVTREEALRRGVIERDAARGAFLFPLIEGRRCRFGAGRLHVEVARVEAGEPVGKPIARFRRSHWAILAVTAMLHAIVVAAIVALPSVH